jgi:hypothetical protein
MLTLKGKVYGENLAKYTENEQPEGQEGQRCEPHQ